MTDKYDCCRRYGRLGCAACIGSHVYLLKVAALQSVRMQYVLRKTQCGWIKRRCL